MQSAELTFTASNLFLSLVYSRCHKLSDEIKSVVSCGVKIQNHGSDKFCKQMKFNICSRVCSHLVVTMRFAEFQYEVHLSRTNGYDNLRNCCVNNNGILLTSAYLSFIWHVEDGSVVQRFDCFSSDK